jgi:hypothetical protein
VPLARDRRAGQVTELAAATGDTLTSPLLPGFALEVGEVFAKPPPPPRRD